MVVIATAIFSVSLIILGTIHNLVMLYAAMVLAGIAQLMAFSSFTYVLYRGLPMMMMMTTVASQPKKQVGKQYSRSSTIVYMDVTRRS
jgi:hypothetical protein